MTKPTYGQDSNFHGKKGRSGPPKGNTNAQRHGMASGKLGPGLAYVEKRVNAFRRQIEAIVINARGKISLDDARHINTAMKHERNGILALKYARSEELSADEQWTWMERNAKCSELRDKALDRLELEYDTPSNVLEALYTRLPAPDSNADLEDK